MAISTSYTELYYDLLDLPESKQRKLLDRLKLENPELYARIAESFLDASELNLSKIVGFHANQFEARHTIADLSGQLVDKYRLLGELGRGGMGIVYEAERADETFAQKLAIKFIQPALTEVVGADFLYLEAQLLARLNHPYIAKVFDGGKHDELIYIAMEKVEGDSLDKVMQQRQLSVKQKLELFLKIADAIEHAHQNRTLHADIKPENIIVDREGSPKVLDFNITQRIESVPSHNDSSLLAFSKKFASPEQIAGKYLNNRSDVYSLGKLLDYMLPEIGTGSDPFCIISKATEIEPEQRYPTVQAMMDDISNILACRPVSIRRHQPLYSLGRLIRRRPFHMGSLAALFCCIAVFSGVLIQKNHQLTREKAIAEDMVFEMTQLMFHSKGEMNRGYSVQNMLELTRRRVLSNPDLPQEMKQKMLLAMMTPVPQRSSEREKAKAQTSANTVLNMAKNE